MSKYYSLAADFAARTDTNWTATFAEIERILGFRLPASARTYSAWWANSRDMHVQHYAWLDNGWRSEDLNLTAERITFRRDAQPATPRGRSTRQGPADRPDAPTLYNFSSVPRRLTGSFSMTWQPIGAISLDQDGRLLFPGHQTVLASTASASAAENARCVISAKATMWSAVLCITAIRVHHSRPTSASTLPCSMPSGPTHGSLWKR